MQKFKKIVLNTALYTVIIMTVFYLFALISGQSEARVSAAKFFVILGFSLAISLSALVFEASVSPLLKYITNYSVLFTAFCVIFLTSGEGVGNAFARVLIAFVIFTVFYLFFVFVYKLARARFTKTAKETEKKPYTPIYKNRFGE
ncbi:MAG: hypothetical protein IIX96_03085 [Clostridia bacterium]|nr:hypothetical protein [Clostridia bacterium]